MPEQQGKTGYWYSTEEAMEVIENTMNTLNKAWKMMDRLLLRTKDAGNYGIGKVQKDVGNAILALDDLYWVYDDRKLEKEG